MKILVITFLNLRRKDHPVSIRYSTYVDHLSINHEVDDLQVNILSWCKKNLLYRILNKILSFFPQIADFCYNAKVALKINKNNYDIILVSTSGILLSQIPSFVKKKAQNSKIFVDMIDPLTANMSFHKLLPSKQEKYKKIEALMMKDIDILILLNQELKDYYKQTYPLLKVIVIEQGINEDIINKVAHKAISKKIKLLYAGILYKEDREAFELYKAIDQKNDTFQLDIYGSFKKDLYPNGRINGIRCFKNQPIYRLPTLYSSADVLVFIDNRDSLQVPGKTLELLASNKPILFIYYDSNSPAVTFCKEYEGIFFSYNNLEAILSTLEEIKFRNINFYNRDLKKYYWREIITEIDKYIDKCM